MINRILGVAAAALMCGTGGAMALDTFDLGGAAKGDPSVVWYKFGGADKVAVFVRGPGDLMYAQVGEPDGSAWTGWAAIGNEALKSSPSCVATLSSRIDCVAVGAGNAVMHITYDAGDHEWSSWESIGGFATSAPSAVRTIVDGNPELNIFVRGPGDLLFINTFDGGSWSDWQNLELTFGGDPGCTDTLVLGAHCYDTSAGHATQYSDLTRESGASVFIDELGGAIDGKVSAVATGNSGNTLRVFVKGPGSRLWFKKWNGSWQEWAQLPAIVDSAPGCAIKKSGGAAFCATIGGGGAVTMIRLENSEI